MTGLDKDSAQLLLQTVATQAQTIKTQAETISRLMGEPELDEDPERPTTYLDGGKL